MENPATIMAFAAFIDQNQTNQPSRKQTNQPSQRRTNQPSQRKTKRSSRQRQTKWSSQRLTNQLTLQIRKTRENILFDDEPTSSWTEDVNLDQYFTTNEYLQQTVFDLVKNKGHHLPRTIIRSWPSCEKVRRPG